MLRKERLLSERLPEGFISLLKRRLLDRSEIKDMNLATVGARMALGVFASENDLEVLPALMAADRLCDGEVPFHGLKCWAGIAAEMEFRYTLLFNRRDEGWARGRKRISAADISNA